VSPERVWSQWLDEVEAAARAVERQALERDVPELQPLPMPAVPWPPALEPRRRQVLATLAAATATVERCRDETATELGRLAHAPARPAATGYTDGATLDVVG
jgi:hypothetical protein